MPTLHYTLVIALAAGLLAAGAPVARAGAACPEAVVFFQTYSPPAPLSIAAFTFDSTFTETWSARVSFDRTQATMFLSGSSSGRCAASVRVIERFDLLGVSPGTELSVTAQLHLDGWAQQSCGGSGCGVRIGGRLRAGPDSSEAEVLLIGPGSPREYIQTTLQQPITLTAGEPVEIQFLLSYGTGPGGGGALAQCDAHYSIAGLPPGVRAIACSGADVTPVRATTWGRVKSIYR